MAAWWFTEALPIAWTACLPLFLFPLLGVFGRGPAGDATRAAAPFADAYIFLFIGGMAIGGAMEHWRLHRRIALHILRAMGSDAFRLLGGILVATASISLWLSNTATAVMMMPIAMALLAQLEAGAGRRLARYGTAMMLAVSYGANIGGIGTKIGTGTNSIFAGFVSERMGIDIAFLEYMALGLPFVLLLLPAAWALLWRHARADAPSGAQGRDVLARELAALGPVGSGERKVAVVFLAAAALWISSDLVRPALAPLVAWALPGARLLGKHYEAGVAMTAALALALWRALPVAALRLVPWSTLLLLGGSFSLAAGVDGSGLGQWLAARLAGLATLALPAQVTIASFTSVGLTAVASNTATISVLLNVLPRRVSLLATAPLAASCDFMLPAGTPPNAIVFGSGRVHLPTMMRIGFLLDLVAALILVPYALLWIRLLFA
jgi:sodium-dependent dicarboxylate transporter 2/3/5